MQCGCLLGCVTNFIYAPLNAVGTTCLVSTEPRKMSLLNERTAEEIEWGWRERQGESAECDYFGSNVDYPARGRQTQLTKPWKLLSVQHGNRWLITSRPHFGAKAAHSRSS